VRRDVWTALVVLSFLGSVGCNRDLPQGIPPDVVVIVIDTARADHFSCYGYDRETTPENDELTRDAVLYRHASSPAPWTLPAHASILSGLPAADCFRMARR
jgi:glucan phosphoethanolaminetransferase (alkaline phosphatase superfamily)